jgi:Asp-tRNA(Asn)/Glu-tRNA(Gln) amidotransferase C subunit
MSAEKPEEPPLGPRETLEHIRTLARVGARSDDVDEMRKQFEMILILVEKALTRSRRK